MSLLRDHGNKYSSVIAPAPARSIPDNLANISPSKPTKSKPDMCKVCRISYRTELDEQYDSLWIECSTGGCNEWHHIKCQGISSNKTKIKAIKWFCHVHREKPPKLGIKRPANIDTTKGNKKQKKLRKIESIKIT